MTLREPHPKGAASAAAIATAGDAAGPTGVDAASERLLVRLGFDIHDGPLQQVYALAQDVRLLREQVKLLLDGVHREQVQGRFDDLESQLGELHRDLHDLAHSLEPHSLLQRPFPEAVERELTALRRRVDVTTSLALEGGFGHLSASQRIALLRVLQEALSNIRHSAARTVTVSLREDRDGIRLDVDDDGHGFEQSPGVEEHDSGRGMGLVSMRERLRLLGGDLEIGSSRAGTRVTATLPAWRSSHRAFHPEG